MFPVCFLFLKGRGRLCFYALILEFVGFYKPIQSGWKRIPYIWGFEGKRNLLNGENSEIWVRERL